MRTIVISHKTFANKQYFHPMSQREQNCHFLINWHYKSLRKVGEATKYNHLFIINHLNLRVSRRNKSILAIAVGGGCLVFGNAVA